MIKRFPLLIIAVLFMCGPSYADVDSILGVSTFEEVLGVSTVDAFAGSTVAAPSGDTISFVETAGNSTSSSVDVVVTPASTVANGNLMILCISADNDSSTWSDISATWTALGTATSRGYEVIECYYREASSEGESYTFTNSSPSSKEAIISVFSKSGGSWATPTTNTTESTAAGNTSLTSDNLMSKADGIMYFAAFHDTGGTISTAPTDMTHPTNGLQNGGSSGQAVYYQATSTAANFSRSITWSAADDQSIIQVAIGLE
jgi:hypothetical protein